MFRNSFHLLIVVACAPCLAGDAGLQLEHRATVLPALTNRCVACHGPEEQEAGIRFDTLSPRLGADGVAAETWHAAMNAIRSGEMPPEDAPQLSDQERVAITGWVSRSIDLALEANRDTSGRVVLRRLNRDEYQHTMSDLLGLEMDYTRDLPPDSLSSDGFSNDGSALRMSGIQLEYYLETARRALDRVIVNGDAPEVFEYTFSESNLDRWLGPAVRSNRLGRRQEFLATMVDRYPESGEFRIRITASAELKPEKGFPLLEVSVGYRPDTQILMSGFECVEITDSDSQIYEFTGRIENFPLPVRGQGKFPGLVVRVRNRYTDGSPLPEAKKDDKKKRLYAEEPHLPAIHIESVDFRGPVFESWPPELHRRILFDSPKRYSDEESYVREVLRRFMTRAYRRPVGEEDLREQVDFYRSMRAIFPTFEEAIRETLVSVLIQPQFLYHFESASAKRREIDPWELASRLSYFLWSTMPDETLLQSAASGELSERSVLQQQVDRMLNDPRSTRFTERFVSQWLELENLQSIAVDRKRYPHFDDELKTHMREETQCFFRELLRSNDSALNLLSSDFTMLNEPLAKHYDIAGVLGQSFRRVPIDSSRRHGGLLGHASVLMLNSTGADSHAVRRAVWIRDRLLDDPPAPPPPDVPSLDEAGAEFLNLPIREQLKVHRERAACAGCHVAIDPWGVALENYDAVGRWREDIRLPNGKTTPVESSDTLPDGTRLDGAESLRRYLLEQKKDEFARSLTVRMMSYALGRRLELSDDTAVNELTRQFAEDGYRIRGLIQSVVASQSFQTK